MSQVSVIDSSDEENYDFSKGIDDILAKYEAAQWEQIYLLNNVFLLTSNAQIQVQCGLSPAKSFSTVVILRNYITGKKLSFSTFERHTLLELLGDIVKEFFHPPLQGHPYEYGWPCKGIYCVNSILVCLLIE